MPRTTPDIETSDVPQAPNLARIRCVVTAIADGAATIEQISEETDISARHIGYSIRAAQTLGLLDAAKEPTPLGRSLLETEQESEAESGVFRRSVEESAILRALAPMLLSPKPPTKKALGARIEKLSGLSKATAEHRASDLLAWREQLIKEPDHDGAASGATKPPAPVGSSHDGASSGATKPPAPVERSEGVAASEDAPPEAPPEKSEPTEPG